MKDLALLLSEIKTYVQVNRDEIDDDYLNWNKSYDYQMGVEDAINDLKDIIDRYEDE